jgi:acyl-CoA thioesterase I
MIVALGSSSTAGAGASSAEATYPSRLMAELARRFPTQSVIVHNRGIGGERAIDMLTRSEPLSPKGKPAALAGCRSLWGYNSLGHEPASLRLLHVLPSWLRSSSVPRFQ